MATPQNFRSAFNGFNRDDVVNYISYMTTRHENEVNQLRSQIEALRQELDEKPAVDETELTGLREQVTRLQDALRQKDETIAGLTAASGVQPAAVPSMTEQELNAYRRAESAERRAIDRVNQMYARANGILADAVVRLDDNTAQIDALSQRVQSELDALRSAVAGSRTLLSDAATAVASIRPEE